MPWTDWTRVTIITADGTASGLYSRAEMRAFERAVDGDMGRLGDFLWDRIMGPDNTAYGNIVLASVHHVGKAAA
jgi:hypothetical protein